jgi:alkylation response protein AidB-like acyl-CoA dehydrogenase
MDFTLTPDQELLRDTARNLLAKECPTSLVRAHVDDRAAQESLWTHLKDFAALGAGECTDLCLFLDELGYVSAPGPFFASVALFAPLALALDTPEVDAVLSGARTGTVALAGRDGIWLPNDDPVKTFVVDADLCEHVAIVGTREVRIIDRPSTLRAVSTADFSRRVFEIDAAGQVAAAIPASPDVLQAWLDRATVAYAAETVGTARRCFDMALQYAKERVQFDAPIGSFQAIQHKLADMSLLVERSTAAVQYAAMTVDAAHPDRTRAAHVAKAAAGEAARRCLKDGMQIHGGIGYTWEHDLQLFLRRATASEFLLGPTGWHHDRIADLLFA